LPHRRLGRSTRSLCATFVVEGLQRVEPGTVFASLPFRVGDTYNDDKGSAAIRSLFALGLFKDVRLEVNGDVLVVIVEERPTVADVDFAGIQGIRQGCSRRPCAKSV
jgi:outer membrane protein assembly factor BamA